MNEFDFIAGLAVGVFQLQKGILKEDFDFQWFKENDYWTLTIYHFRVFSLKELIKADHILRSYCECKNIIIGNGFITICVDIKEGGE